MANRTDSPDPRAERVRTLVKGASLALAREQRLETVSVADIAARAGVSRQVVYQHFSDRDEAVAAAVAEALDRALAPAGGDPAAVVRLTMRFALENAAVYRNTYPSTASLRIAAASRERLRPACRALVETRAALSAAPPPLPLEELTTFLLGGLMEVLTAWCAAPSPESPEARADQLAGSLLRLMATPPPAAGPAAPPQEQPQEQPQEREEEQRSPRR